MSNQMIFKDSRGKRVYPGDRIKILKHYVYGHREGYEGVVKWNQAKGLLRVYYDKEGKWDVFEDFYSIHEFIKI